MRCILLSLYVKLYQFGNILVVMHLFWCYQRNRLQGIVAWFRTTRTLTFASDLRQMLQMPATKKKLSFDSSIKCLESTNKGQISVLVKGLMLTFFGASISRIVSSCECEGNTATGGETPALHYAVRQRQKVTVKSLLQDSEIKRPELLEFVYQQMAGKEIHVDILQLLIASARRSHDPSVVRSNSTRTGRDRWLSLGACIFSISFRFRAVAESGFYPQEYILSFTHST
jgi:hypothetical protein